MPELVLSVAYALLFLFCIPGMALFTGSSVKPRIFQWIFGFKLLAAIGLYLIYTLYYTNRPFADIFRYYDDSAIISGSFNVNPWDYFRMLTGFDADNPELSHYYQSMRNWYNTDLAFNDSRTMIRLCAFMRILTFGNYFPQAVIMSFLAMCGLTGMFRLFDKVLPGRELFLIAGIFLLPSTIFWTSGVIKEAFLVFAAGTFLYQFVSIDGNKSFTPRRILFLLLTGFCLFLIKSYFMFLMLPGIVALLFFRNKPHLSRHTIIIHLVYYLLIIYILPPLVTGKKLPELLASKQQEFIQLAEFERAGSYIQIPQLDNSYQSLFIHAPAAMLRVLSRPFITEISNPLMLLSAIENLVLNLVLIICIAGITSSIKFRWKSLQWSALFLLISLSVLIGLTTPVLGAVVRYKVPLLPFLVFVAATLSSSKWIEYKTDILYK